MSEPTPTVKNTNLLTDLDWLQKSTDLEDGIIKQIIDNTKDYIIYLEASEERLHKMEEVLDTISKSDLTNKQAFLDNFKEFFNE